MFFSESNTWYSIVINNWIFGNFFPEGRDASRAFVTGDYSEAGLVDDINGLSSSEILTLHNWLSFYEKNYVFVGM
jgi:hypothetical protein